ncbi:MAG: YhbY family RNA-binding protein [Promethearchaeota archaeon]
MGYKEEFKKVLLNKPHIILGKKGITDEFIQHVVKLLKRYKIIKIKSLKAITNKTSIKQIANAITEMTNSYLLDVRGRIIIVSKNKIKKKL